MKKITAIFKQFWFVSLLGTLALAVLFWFLTPLMGLESVLGRWIGIAILFLIWLILAIVMTLRAKRKEKAMMAELAETQNIDPDAETTAENIETLSTKMQEALSVLKKTRLGGASGKQFLYQLPWYIIIGPPGVGKTTLLANSNLHYPLEEQFGKKGIGGVGGTRQCDWWFTDEAVLLDTAGRYATQDSNAKVDSKEWLGFLDLLKKYRQRRPINGVILAISINDLLQKSEAEREQEALTLRARIQELYEHFDIRFPVYFMLTKCDLLAGFNEYFDHMEEDSRAQVWGLTFPLNEDPKANIVDQFNIEFDLLEERLHQQTIERLERERNETRRQTLYLFPQQFSSLQTLLESFLQDVFRPSRYQHNVMLRGIYFSSATQEGSPIDRIMSALSQNFGMNHQQLSGFTGQGKSFYINRLLKEVIFAEKGLAGSNASLERRRAWLHRGALIGIGSLTVLLSLAFLTSYFMNRALISDFETKTAEIQTLLDEHKARDDLLKRLPILNAARELPSGYAAQQEDDTPLASSFGLYQGEKLGEAAVSKYRELLRTVLLPPLLLRLEEQMRDYMGDSDYLFEVLRVYLMLESKNKPHYEGSTIQAWIEEDWKNTLDIEVTNKQRQALRAHLQALFELQPLPLPRPLDEGLIQQARNELSGVDATRLAYERLKRNLLHPDDAPDFKISEAAGPLASTVFARRTQDLELNDGVPGLFTFKGYYQVFAKEGENLGKLAAKNAWVLNEESLTADTSPENIDESAEEAAKRAEEQRKKEEEKLKNEILTFYFEDYKKEWDALLFDIEIHPLTTLEQAEEVLRVLSDPKESPLSLLLDAVRLETDLNRAQEGLEDEAAKRLNQGVQKAGSKLGVDTSNAADASRLAKQERGASPKIVSAHFRKLNALTKGKTGGSVPLDRIIKALDSLYTPINAAYSTGGDEISEQVRKKVETSAQKLNKAAMREPRPISTLLAELSRQANQLVSETANTQQLSKIEKAWQSDVLPFCSRSIQGFYPLSAGRREMALQDFETFFGPNGKLDTFYKTYLEANIDTTGELWRWKTDSDESMNGLAPEKLRYFQLAQTIREAFFPSGSLAMPFTIKALNGGNENAVITLEIDGQKINNELKGKQEAMQWPNGGSEQIFTQLKLITTPPPPVVIPEYDPETGEEIPAPPLPEPEPEEDIITGPSFEGPWALLRLLEKRGKASSAQSYRFSLSIQGRSASFELKAKSSANNPFQVKDKALRQFKCPNSLL